MYPQVVGDKKEEDISPIGFIGQVKVSLFYKSDIAWNVYYTGNTEESMSDNSACHMTDFYSVVLFFLQYIGAKAILITICAI